MYTCVFFNNNVQKEILLFEVEIKESFLLDKLSMLFDYIYIYILTMYIYIFKLYCSKGNFTF